MRAKVKSAKDYIGLQILDGVGELEHILPERARHRRAVVLVACAQYRDFPVSAESVRFQNSLRLAERLQKMHARDDQLEFQFWTRFYEPHDWLQPAVVGTPLGNEQYLSLLHTTTRHRGGEGGHPSGRRAPPSSQACVCIPRLVFLQYRVV